MSDLAKRLVQCVSGAFGSLASRTGRTPSRCAPRRKSGCPIAQLAADAGTLLHLGQELLAPSPSSSAGRRRRATPGHHRTVTSLRLAALSPAA